MIETIKTALPKTLLVIGIALSATVAVGPADAQTVRGSHSVGNGDGQTDQSDDRENATSSSRPHKPRYQAFFRTRMGMVKAPFYLADIPEVRSEITQALSFVVGGQLRLDTSWTVRTRFGMAPSLVALPAGSYADAKAFGNLELGLSKKLAPKLFHGTDQQIGGAIVLPTATHGPSMSVLRNRVLAISDAIEGWQNRELFTPGVAALVGSYAATVRHRQHRVALTLKAPLLIRVRDASVPSEANMRRFSFTPTAALSGETTLTSWFGLGFAAHVATSVPSPVELPGGWVQASVEPRLLFQVGEHIHIRTDLLIPIGGPLSGSAGLGIGVRGQL